MDHESLDEIGVFEGTAKSSLETDLLRHYERAFAGMRDDAVQLLEIGIATGASLRTWKRYFARGTIIGVDIAAKCRRFAEDRIKVEIGSQADPAFLARLASRYQPNIIIDDGSHRPEHIFLTFEALFPSLQPGGFYVVEDVDLHHGSRAERWHGSGGETATEHFALLAQRLAGNYTDPDGGAAARHAGQSIDRVEFISRAIIVQKRQAAANPVQRAAELWDLAEKAGQRYNWERLSMVFLRHRELERAELAAERAVTISPTSANCLIRLGHIQALRGNVSAAVETARRGLQIAPKNPVFQSQVAEFEGRLANADRTQDAVG